MSYWQGKRALIIGGSAGLGRAIADVLAQYGARIAIVGRRQSQLDIATKELKACGADVAFSGPLGPIGSVLRVGVLAGRITAILTRGGHHSMLEEAN